MILPITQHVRIHIPPDPLVDWYIIKSMSMREAHCIEWLRALMEARDAYTPTRPVANDSRRVPCLPGYVFVRFPEPPDWSMLDQCVTAQPKLFKIFSHEMAINGQIVSIYVPFLVKDADICELKAREQSGTLSTAAPIIPTLLNKRVRVPHGPFMGHVAKVKAISDGVAKLRLKSSILGKPIYLSIPLEDIS